MSRTDDEFFDELEAHIKALKDDPTEVNRKSNEFIYCLLGLAAAALDNRKLGYEE